MKGGGGQKVSVFVHNQGMKTIMQGGGHCVLNGILCGHFLEIKMQQWNKSLN